MAEVTAPYGTQIAFIAVSTIIIITPILRYVSSGWATKRDDIMNSIDDNAKQIYLEKFEKYDSKRIKDDYKRIEDVKSKFKKIYHRRFGRRFFIVPIFLLFILAVLVASICVESITGAYLWAKALELNLTGLSAVAGAYMWVVSDSIWRAYRLDLAPANVLWGVLRLFIAAPLGIAVSSILNNQVFAFVAFGLGAFPLETILMYLRQLSAKQLQVDPGAVERSQLSNLEGVEQRLVDRLEYQDITSVVQLAYCNPIQLTMRSNLSFNKVVDLVSQSLSWIYIGDKLASIRPLGFRGAYDIRQLCEDLAPEKADSHEQRNANQIAPVLAQQLGMTQDTMWYVINMIAYDPYTDFIYKAWS
jgi:hypothetical protein